MKNLILRSCFALGVLLLSACGGSGASGAPTGDDDDDTNIQVDGGASGPEAGMIQIDGNTPETGTGALDPCQILEAGPDCSYEILSGPACGDGIINQDFEVCDDGNGMPGDGCSGACTIEPNFECPTPGQPCRSTIVCGDGRVQGGEVCDDGNTTSGDGCPSTCDTIESGWLCDTPGAACVRQDPCKSLSPPASCFADAGPPAPVCGDGQVNQASEACDDGNTTPGDGCSGVCTVEPNYTCPSTGGPCTSNIRCGNSVREVGESCDDGNTAAGDGCSPTCVVESGDWVCPTAGQPCQRISFCGDGRIKGAETCDDANTASGDGCDSNCQKEPGWTCLVPAAPCTPVEVCGDGKVSGSRGEVCDDGNARDGDGCSADCRFVESGWVCPTPGQPCQNNNVCGNGKVTGNERCDDGNTKAGDGCSATCTLETGYECPFPGAPCLPRCGDGTRILNEQCDDGNTANGDGCSSTCEWEPGWACTGTPPNYSCHRTTCGDKTKEGTEGCDDGNQDLGDGCTPLCTLEPSCSSSGCQSTCGDGLVLASVGEICDDGNNVSGDGCSSTCQVEAGYECQQPPLGDTMAVPMVVRDFNAGADFEKGAEFARDHNYATQGLVQNALDSRGLKPVLASTMGMYNGTSTDSGIASAASFAQWYDDAAPASVNSRHGSLATTLNLYLNQAGTAYVNRFGVNGDGLTAAKFERLQSQTCISAAQVAKDATGAPIPCVACYYDADPTTPQCDGNGGAPQYCNINGQQPDRCALVGTNYVGTIVLGSFDGNPLFFPADAFPQPWSPASTAQISGNYDPSWPADPTGRNHNFSFTTEVRFWFMYEATRAFNLTFVGDDDVWVFINKRLAVDLGGIHAAVQGALTFGSTGAPRAVVTPTNVTGATPITSNPSLGLQNGNVYEIVVFQAERQTLASSYQLSLSGFNAAKSKCGPICGDGILAPGEACDNGTNPGGYGQCNPDCTRGPYCGDSIVTSPNEECDNGVNTSPYGASGCGPDCKFPARCGDGIVQTTFGETCDDGVNSGAYGGCTSNCLRAAWCGDGVVQSANEQCDDGVNDGAYNNCAPGCVLGPRCGDGVIQAEWGEECDDGNTARGDGCGPTCQTEGKCGDAVVQSDLGETCDDGVNDGSYGHCTPDCQPGPRCGDGVVNGTEACDDGVNSGAYGTCAPGCVLGPRCGDNIVNGSEQCDDGVNDGSSGCLPGCVTHCGDSVVQSDLGEQCDDGVNDGGYGECQPQCKLGPRCGDSQVQTGFGEQCDDGVNDGGYGECFPGCKLGARCGDGQVQSSQGEICDDGVNAGGYGACAPGCRLGLYCGDNIVTAPYEQCDDGNHTAGDGCSAACQIERVGPA